MVNKLFELATKFKTPITIGALALVVLYLIYQAILNSSILSPLEEESTFNLVNSIVNWVFYLAMVGLILGILTFAFEKYLSDQSEKSNRSFTITGNVFSNDGAPVKGALVFVDGVDRQKETDSIGWFSIEVNEQNSWTVRASYQGINVEQSVKKENFRKPVRLVLNNEAVKSTSLTHNQLSSPEYLFRGFQEAQLISSALKNQEEIPSNFLLLTQCTIMMWVQIPAKGYGLRGGPTFRYLIAYRTHLETEKDFNVFALRYFPPEENQWGLWLSNNKAESLDALMIDDDLQPGWRQFVIRWDHSIPKLVFTIDGGEGGYTNTSSYRAYWPTPKSNNAFIGSWVAPPVPFDDSYCETQIYDLRIVGKYLNSQDILVFSESPPTQTGNVEENIPLRRIFQVSDKHFDADSDPQKIVIEFTNLGEHAIKIRKILYTDTGFGLPKEALLSTYTKGERGRIVILNKAEGRIESKQPYLVELELGQKWKSADINRWSGEWGYLRIYASYDDSEEEIEQLYSI